MSCTSYFTDIYFTLPAQKYVLVMHLITCVPSSGPPTILKPNPVSALFRLMLRLVHCSFQPGGTGWLGCKWAGCIEWLGTGAEFSNEVAPVCCKEVGGWLRLFCRACARALWSVGFGVFDLNLKQVNRKTNINWMYHNYHIQFLMNIEQDS